jgi:uncharacterized membrane protein YphA (DoxX/SURF4 family)
MFLRATRLGDALETRIAWLPPLLARLLFGLAVFETGRGRWGNLAGATELFASLGILLPGANAVVVATLERAGGLARIAGAFTRFFAAGLAGTMVAALFTAHPSGIVAAQGASGLLEITPVAYLLPLSWLAVRGAGVVAADKLLRALRRRPVQARTVAWPAGERPRGRGAASGQRLPPRMARGRLRLAREDPEQRRLACAVLSCHPDARAGLRGEAEAFENGAVPKRHRDPVEGEERQEGGGGRAAPAEYIGARPRSVRGRLAPSLPVRCNLHRLDSGVAARPSGSEGRPDRRTRFFLSRHRKSGRRAEPPPGRLARGPRPSARRER